MTRPVNGVLLVSEYISLGGGSYQFENAVFSNYTDATGNGAYDVQVGALLYIPATDINTAIPVSGVFHRYRLSSLTVNDPYTLSGTVDWDEEGEEQDSPTNNSFSVLAEPTLNLQLGIPSLDAIYPELSPGASLASVLNDIRFIIDKLANSSNTVIDNLIAEVETLKETVNQLQETGNQNSVDVRNLQANQPTYYSHVQDVPVKIWEIIHNKNSMIFTYTLLDGTGRVVIPDEVRVISPDEIQVSFRQDSVGQIHFFFH